jgi:hypothetical protein
MTGVRVPDGRGLIRWEETLGRQNDGVGCPQPYRPHPFRHRRVFRRCCNARWFGRLASRWLARGAHLRLCSEASQRRQTFACPALSQHERSKNQRRGIKFTHEAHEHCFRTVEIICFLNRAVVRGSAEEHGRHLAFRCLLPLQVKTLSR